MEITIQLRHHRGRKQMNLTKDLAAWTLLPLGIMGVVLFGVFGFGAFRQGYAWSEMDWNKDGRTTIAEFLHSDDIGKRQIQVNGVMCSEFYELKDGMPIRTICPQAPDN
jgi:hypothetical protein